EPGVSLQFEWTPAISHVGKARPKPPAAPGETRPMTAPSDVNVMPIRLSERAQAPRVLRLHPDDNVIVSIDPILPGAVAEGITAVSRVPKGNKMAPRAVAGGGPVLKFGQIIGFATVPIRPGEHVHEHNCGVHDFARDYRFAEFAEPERVLPV